MVKYNLGCGNKHLKGFVNVDKDDRVNPDELWDLNVLPYKMVLCDEVVFSHSLEHLEDFGMSLSECFKHTDKVSFIVPAPASPNYKCSDHKYFFKVFSLCGSSLNLPFWLQRLLGLFIVTEYKIVVERLYDDVKRNIRG